MTFLSYFEVLNVTKSLVTKYLNVAKWQSGKVASATVYCLLIKAYYAFVASCITFSLPRVLRFVGHEVTSRSHPAHGADSHTLSWPLRGQPPRRAFPSSLP